MRRRERRSTSHTLKFVKLVIDGVLRVAGVEDGTLVDLTQFTRVLFHGLPINRMTSHLFEGFKPFFENEEGDAKKFGAKLGETLRTKLEFAQGDHRNTGEIGDIFTIPPKLWLVRNEVGGWTAMYPEDY